MEKAEQIAAISEGNYHEALHLLQHADDDWDQWLRGWLNDIIRQPGWDRSSGSMKWPKPDGRNKTIPRYFTHLLDMAIRVKISGETGPTYAENRSATEFALSG